MLNEFPARLGIIKEMENGELKLESFKMVIGNWILVIGYWLLIIYHCYF